MFFLILLIFKKKFMFSSAVLNFSLPTENVQSLIMGILTYHPHEIQYVMDLPERPSNDFEARLAEVYCKSFKKLSEKHPQTFGAQNTIPLLIQRVIEELDRIWEKNEEFCEKRLFLWKIACFIKRTFHLPNSHGQLEVCSLFLILTNDQCTFSFLNKTLVVTLLIHRIDA